MVRTITIGCGIQGKDLPAGLTGGVQKIDKLMGDGTETADAVLAGQAADGHNHAGFVAETKILCAVHKISPLTKQISVGNIASFIIQQQNRECNDKTENVF